MGSKIHVTRVSDRKKKAEKVLEEIMVENFPKLSRDKPTDLRSCDRILNRINSKKPHQDTS